MHVKRTDGLSGHQGELKSLAGKRPPGGKTLAGAVVLGSWKLHYYSGLIFSLHRRPSVVIFFSYKAVYRYLNRTLSFSTSDKLSDQKT
eukprot:scaffold6124_cov122-Cylindrotheca_fusiformis.AAC.26